MRTDRTPDRDDRASDAASSALSRRAFVLASGAAAATGGIVGGATGGIVGGATGGSVLSVDVGATAPYLPRVRELVRAYERTDASTTVRLHWTGRPPSERALDGPADVRVSGQPVVPTGRSGIDDGTGWTLHDVAVRGWAALAHPDHEWRECLRRREVRRQWRSDVPVETWSESDWAAIDGVDRANGRAKSRGTSDVTDRGTSGAANRRSADPAVLVRGTRSYQYSQGSGGVGSYGVEPDAIEVPPEDRVVRTGAYTPVVRLEYVHVSDEVRSDDRVEALLRYFSRGTRDASGTVAQFVDAGVDDDR